MVVLWSWFLLARAVISLGHHAGFLVFMLPAVAWAGVVVPVYMAMRQHVRNQALEEDCDNLREVLYALKAESARIRELRRHPVAARLLVLGSEWEVRNL